METEDKKKEQPIFEPVQLQYPGDSRNAVERLQLNGGQPQQQSTHGDASMTWDQVQQAQHDPRPLSETGKVPGSGEVKLNDTARNMGVWEGSPEALTYDRMLAEMRRRHPAESVEERRERLKRQRRNQLFAALGDGISALSNLYFTTKGSPSADQSKTMSKALRDAYDKADKDREAEERSNLNTMLQVMNQQRLAHSAWLARKNQAELIELRKKAAEAGNKAAMRRVDELMRHNTELERQAREAAEQENKRKNEEMENRNKNRDEQTSIAKKKAATYASGVANQNANRNSRTANSNKNADRRTAIQATKAAKSGRDGAPHYNTSETVVWYDKQGQKHSRTTKSNSGGGGTRKKIQHKNNLGL